jgi:patatin-like phospholipase
LQACASLPRLDAVPPTLTERAVIPGIPNSRFWLDGDLAPFIKAALQDNERQRKTLAKARKTTDPLPSANLLAISGGSDAGAFAAGLLAGWTAHGGRPEFMLVTGISAGALIAPFAFLGPQYDDAIRSVFTSVRSEDIFIGAICSVVLPATAWRTADPCRDSLQSTSRQRFSPPWLKDTQSVVAPHLRSGRFKATDKLITSLRTGSFMRSEKTSN